MFRRRRREPLEETPTPTPKPNRDDKRTIELLESLEEKFEQHLSQWGPFGRWTWHKMWDETNLVIPPMTEHILVNYSIENALEWGGLGYVHSAFLQTASLAAGIRIRMFKHRRQEPLELSGTIALLIAGNFYAPRNGCYINSLVSPAAPPFTVVVQGSPNFYPYHESLYAAILNVGPVFITITRTAGLRRVCLIDREES